MGGLARAFTRALPAVIGGAFFGPWGAAAGGAISGAVGGGGLKGALLGGVTGYGGSVAGAAAARSIAKSWLGANLGLTTQGLAQVMTPLGAGIGSSLPIIAREQQKKLLQGMQASTNPSNLSMQDIIRTPINPESYNIVKNEAIAKTEDAFKKGGIYNIQSELSGFSLPPLPNIPSNIPNLNFDNGLQGHLQKITDELQKTSAKFTQDLEKSAAHFTQTIENAHKTTTELGQNLAVATAKPLEEVEIPKFRRPLGSYVNIYNRNKFQHSAREISRMLRRRRREAM